MAKAKPKRKSSRAVSRQNSSDDNITKRKVIFVLKDLIFFAVLFAICMVLWHFSTSSIYLALFELLSIIFGFIALAFLIALLVLLFIQFFRKK